MIYTSTRSNKKFSFEEIIKKGMPIDGGLFVPVYIPKINFINLKNIKYYKLVRYVLSKFMTKEEYKKFQIKKISYQIYKKYNVFSIKKIKNRNIFIVDLNRGKTFSFKDISISFLSKILDKINNLNILTATSGDTGSSCIYYLRKLNKSKIFVFSPLNKISSFQESQMYSVKKKNIYNVSIIGNFDNCQKIIKKNLIFKNINTVNSVNFLRIILQVIYYIKCYLIIRKKNTTFAIPTGNFGNSFSSYLAYKMGLPIKRIFVVNNDNNTSYNFINKKELFYGKRLKQTNSPSMDIINPSNIERILFYLFKKNKILKIFDKLKKNKKIKLKKKLKIFESYYCNKNKRKNIIKFFFKKYQKLLDPHTANLFVLNFNKKFSYFLLNTANVIKFLKYINIILNKNFYSKFQIQIEKIKKKYFSFKNKDKKKILNFIKKNLNFI
ncbi:hypothetical protein [Candidatus Vidania fulgoroideorum]